MGKESTATLIQLKSVRKERNFTIVPNALFGDRRLDWGALALLLDLLHLPPDYPICQRWLSNRRPSGETATRSMTRALQALGYLRCSAERDDRGRVARWTWEVCEWPVPEWSDAYTLRNRKRNTKRKSAPERDFPHLDSSSSGKTRAKLNTAVPIRTTSNESTTTAVESHTTLIWPDRLDQSEVVVVSNLIKNLGSNEQQQVLDEMQGTFDDGKQILCLASWTEALVQASINGTFRPSRGVRVRKKREARAQIAVEQAARRAIAAQVKATFEDPDEIAKRRVKLAQVRAELGGLR